MVVRGRVELPTFRFSGFLWGSGIVSRRCGVFVGLAEASGWSGQSAAAEYPATAGLRIPMTTFLVTQRHRSGLPACGDSAPITCW